MLAASTSLATNFLSPVAAVTTASSSSFLRHDFKPFSSPHSQPSIKMSSSPSQPSLMQFIEHVIFFKVKPDTQSSKVNDMLTNLNDLVSLESVLHLSAGPILRHRSSSLTFTHMLHSRYSTKSDLASYARHHAHLRVAKDYVHPIIDDVMAVDWVAVDATGPVRLPPGSAFRVTIAKLKENVGEDGREKVLGVIGGIKDKFPGIEQFHFGVNFSPTKAKGFSIASIAVFKGLEGLEALDNESERANAEKDKVRELLDGVLVVDYVVPSS